LPSQWPRESPNHWRMLDGRCELPSMTIWDRWKNPETVERLTSCTIIVTEANELTRAIHDRMPAVLDKGDVRPWLNGEGGAELLRPAPEDRLRMWAVSRRVNKTGQGDDDPTLLDVAGLMAGKV